jgi:adenylosuccinate synthase
MVEQSGSISSSNSTPNEKSKSTGIDVVLGAQWGDEGKGKLVDLLSQVRKKQ